MRTSTAPEPTDLLVENFESRVGVSVGPALVPLESDLEVVDAEPDGCALGKSSAHHRAGKGTGGKGRTEERRVSVPLRHATVLILRGGPVVVLAEPALEHVDLVLRTTKSVNEREE
jgi:hypothetical protein